MAAEEELVGGGMLPAISKNKGKHPNPNQELITCFKSALTMGYKAIADLKKNWKGASEYCVPCDPSGNKLCLKFQYTGKCKHGCGRSKCHIAHGNDTVAKLHQHLTDCGVPN